MLFVQIAMCPGTKPYTAIASILVRQSLRNFSLFIGETAGKHVYYAKFIATVRVNSTCAISIRAARLWIFDYFGYRAEFLAFISAAKQLPPIA